MKNRKVLSICIPTFNRRERVKKLVIELLKNKRNDFEVVVLDNMSNDNTYNELLKIKDSRLSLYANKKYISAIENGNKVLELGKSKYCMLFNDREIAQNQYLDKIIEFLKEDEYSFVYVYQGEKNRIKIFEKKQEAREYIMEHVGFHPTGLIYNREFLKRINLKEYIDYDRINFFPHFFIAYDIIAQGKMAIYESKFWRLAEEEFLRMRKSKYVDLSKPLYFTPENKIDRLYKFSNHIISDQMSSNSEKKLLLIKLFFAMCYNATYYYVYYEARNKNLCIHNGTEPKSLNFIDCLKIGKKFKKDYLSYLKDQKYDLKFQIELESYKVIFKSVKARIKKVIKDFYIKFKGK